jgi:hypothetical protein
MVDAADDRELPRAWRELESTVATTSQRFQKEVHKWKKSYKAVVVHSVVHDCQLNLVLSILLSASILAWEVYIQVEVLQDKFHLLIMLWLLYVASFIVLLAYQYIHK